MAKRKNIDQKLRQEIEILRAQLKISPGNVSAIDNSADNKQLNTNKKLSFEIDTTTVKKDLLKTAVISTLAFSIIIALWILQNPPAV